MKRSKYESINCPRFPPLWFVYILMPGKEERVLLQLGSQHKCVERSVRTVFPGYLFLVTMFATNFKNCVHQQKKAPNKSTKFVINEKSVSISQNERFLEKYDFSGPKSYFHLNTYLKKKGKKRFPLPEIRYYFKYWPRSNFKNGFQNNMNERISLSLNRKYVATDCNNGLA